MQFRNEHTPHEWDISTGILQDLLIAMTSPFARCDTWFVKITTASKL